MGPEAGPPPPGAVSVVIPTRGRHELVLRAIRSATEQRPAPFEVIVVADGPDPELAAVIGDAQTVSCRLIELPNRVGAAAARNAGVQAARGEWVALLDDDDEWLPGKLGRQLAAAAAASCARPVVSGAVSVRTPRATFTLPRRLPAAGEPVSEWLTIRHGLFHGEGFVQTSTLLAPRRLFLEQPFDVSLPRLQETDWLLRVLHEGACLTVVPALVAVWHDDEDRPRVTDVGDWRVMVAWARARRELFTPRAYAALLLSVVAAMPAARYDLRAFPALLREAFANGRPAARDLLTYLQVWLVPRALRRRLRDRMLGRSSGGSGRHG